jgi:hypothetical protein
MCASTTTVFCVAMRTILRHVDRGKPSTQKPVAVDIALSTGSAMGRVALKNTTAAKDGAYHTASTAVRSAWKHVPLVTDTRIFAANTAAVMANASAWVSRAATITKVKWPAAVTAAHLAHRVVAMPASMCKMIATTAVPAVSRAAHARFVQAAAA